MKDPLLRRDVLFTIKDVALSLGMEVPKDWFPPSAALGGGSVSVGGFRVTKGTRKLFKKRATRAAELLHLTRREKALALHLADDSTVTPVHAVVSRMLLQRSWV